MSFDCNAPFIAYSLLSTFSTINENERDAVQLILELIPCYDVLSKELYVTHEAHAVAQILLDELRMMASRHSYVQESALEDIAEARDLLNVIVLPLVHHLSESEYSEIRRTIEDADKLLSNSLDLLNELLTVWRLRNIDVVNEWHSYPIEGLEHYHSGMELPNGVKLEELLMPLPYPTKLHSSDSGYSTEDEGPKQKPERRRKRQIRSYASESGKPRAVPRSEGARELALKSKPRPKSKHFFLPRFTSSRTSSDSAHDSGDISDSSRSYNGHFRRYPNFVERGDEIECLCETGHVCLLHPDGHPSDYEVDVRIPRRKRLVNLVKTVVMRL
ncbi:uroporphyrinogen decarboxylase, putative [Rhizoctonia solani AG-3 Rhs1AP]|uniref:Uroporphyrinogen decarboxylase, putative n=1 Tax=Rhizoctonia solani AG-3 Rhs1AP TaxID=1086054 RepID=X8J4N7_9AGAM|nr:uroporphyrinogen decarboxylase, putative [Rhizoctonia solani AG-3 Rhs1AP]